MKYKAKQEKLDDMNWNSTWQVHAEELTEDEMAYISGGEKVKGSFPDPNMTGRGCTTSGRNYNICRAW